MPQPVCLPRLHGSTLSCRPPVSATTGMAPYRIAYIWVSPQGSVREGIRKKSAPPKILRASSSLCSRRTATFPGRLFERVRAASSSPGFPVPRIARRPPFATSWLAAPRTRSTPLSSVNRLTIPKIGRPFAGSSPSSPSSAARHSSRPRIEAARKFFFKAASLAGFQESASMPLRIPVRWRARPCSTSCNPWPKASVWIS